MTRFAPQSLRQRRRCLPTLAAVLAGLGSALTAPSASACGGFFCGQQPVDQSAERILFEVGDESVTMTTQITFRGEAEDFAWILPLSEVPDPKSLALFPQRALTALDAQTGPVFRLPEDSECYQGLGVPQASVAVDEAAGEPAVEVLLRAEVGPYGVAVIESEDPQALVDWLRAEDYRITPAMEPYIELYTQAGLKFLALKLQQEAGIEDIQPFRFSLPGTTPTIPLRMTALAAEPEMSVAVFLLGQQRFEGKNWDNLTIAEDRIRYNPFDFSFPFRTNWASLVAQAVDEAGGHGWVTEFAGSTRPLLSAVQEQLERGNFRTPEDQEAAESLARALEGQPYLTRLYTRLSAEEMTSDPVLGLSSGGGVDRTRQLSRFVEGEDMCSEDRRVSDNPCDFTTCGAGGLCRVVTDASGNESAACACVPGATARATASPDGTSVPICQDGRLSFMNPGERESEEAPPFPDPCVTFSCGGNGRCVAMNLTPTCVCDQGYVASGGLTDSGPNIDCVLPKAPVPVDFYAQRLPALPEGTPGGRAVPVQAPLMNPATGEMLDPVPSPPGTGEPTATGGFPTPRPNPDLVAPPTGSPEPSAPATRSSSSGGCSVGRGPVGGLPASPWALGALVALGLVASRRRS